MPQPLPDTAASPAAARDAAAAAADPARRPRVAIDLRALVLLPTGIGVYTRSLAIALAARGGMRYLGVAHRPPRGAEELAAAGIDLEEQRAPLGVVWQQLLLPRRLRRGDVDLLWSPLLTLPLDCPVPAVATAQSSASACCRSSPPLSAAPAGWSPRRAPPPTTSLSITPAAPPRCEWSI